MKPLKSTFLGLMLIFVAWSASQFFAGGLFEVYFFNMGVPIEEIYLANALWFLASIPLVQLARKMDAKKFMVWGSLISIISIIILIFPFEHAAVFFRLVYGLHIVLFWVPFNILFYEYSNKNNAFMGSIYFSIGPFVSLLLPAASGILAGVFGFASLFIVAMISYAVTIALTLLFAPERKFQYDMRGAIKAISGLKALVFIEGFSTTTIMSMTLPIMVLSYLTQPVEVGWFLSFVTIFSVIASIVLSRISDKNHNRRIFLIISAAGIGIGSLFTGFSTDLIGFFFGFGMVKFFMALFSPVVLALIVDNSKSLVDSMAGREIMLNIGRITGGIFGWVVLLYSDLGTVLIIQGATAFLYIAALEMQKGKIKM